MTLRTCLSRLPLALDCLLLRDDQGPCQFLAYVPFAPVSRDVWGRVKSQNYREKLRKHKKHFSISRPVKCRNYTLVCWIHKCSCNIVIIIKYFLNFKGVVPQFYFIFWNEKIGRVFLYSLALFLNQLLSRHHQSAKHLFGLLPLLPFLSPLWHILLVWQ